MLPRSTREALGMVAKRRSYSLKEKQPIHRKQRGLCKGCRIKLPVEHMTIDHIRSLNRGGKDIPSNWQLLCGRCNSIKGDRPMTYPKKRLKGEKVGKK